MAEPIDGHGDVVTGEGRRDAVKAAVTRRAYPVMRRYWRFRGPRLTLGVRALVVDEEQRVLLVRHSYRDGWFLPGGGVKTEESLVDAIARELREETGLVPKRNSHRVHGVYSSFLEHKSDHVVVFVIDECEGELRSHGGEITGCGFFGADDLPEGTSPATQRRIKELVTGAPIGHRW